MGDEPAGWTTDTLLAYLQRQLDDLRANLQERFDTQAKALVDAFRAQQAAQLKAEVAADKRFAAVNEFRAHLADQQATFMSRELGEAQISENRDRINTLTARLDRMEGAALGAASHISAARATTAQILTVVGVVIAFGAAVVGIVIK